MCRFILPTVLVLCFGGCVYPISEHPLVDPDSCKTFPELHGKYKISFTYESGMVSDGTMQVDPAGEGFPKGFMRIETRGSKDDPDGKSEFFFVVFAETIGNSYVIHYPVNARRKVKKLGNTWNAKQCPGYYFVVLTKTDTGFTFRFLDSDFFKNQITSGSLKGKGLRIFDETTELKRFFEKTPIEEMSIPYEEGHQNVDQFTITKVN